MSNPVSVTVQQFLTAKETISGGDLGSTGATLTHSGYNVALTLGATSTPPAAQCAYSNHVLTSGSGSIDLTNTPGTNGVAINFTGQKICAVQIQAPATNAAAITITPAGSNGYNLFGASSSVTLHPGDSLNMAFNGTLPAVGSTAKALTLTGTGSTDNLNIGFIGG